MTDKREMKKITMETLEKAEHKVSVVKAGYPSSIDATFKPGGARVDDVVVALVNGRPVFGVDLRQRRALSSQSPPYVSL